MHMRMSMCIYIYTHISIYKHAKTQAWLSVMTVSVSQRENDQSVVGIPEAGRLLQRVRDSREIAK